MLSCRFQWSNDEVDSHNTGRIHSDTVSKPNLDNTVIVVALSDHDEGRVLVPVVFKWFAFLIG